MDTSKIAVDKVEQHWPAILIRKQCLIVMEQDYPPMESSSVNFPASSYLNVSRASEGYKVLIKLLHLRKLGPFRHAL